MIVSELITHLATMPPDAPVVIEEAYAFNRTLVPARHDHFRIREVLDGGSQFTEAAPGKAGDFPALVIARRGS